MDESSFSIADDIVSFTGPGGPVTATGYSWPDPYTLEVTFAPQTALDPYEMVIGPDILDLAGNAMDQDYDGVPGETPDDRYTAIFTITAPTVFGHSPSLETQAPVESIRFDFNHDMDESSFSIADDIVSFTGPGGPITATGYSWPDPYTLEVTFDPQTTLGPYEMVIGPDVLDLAGNAMDRDRDYVPGETPDDRYTAIFTITAPRVYWHAPSPETQAPVDSIWLYFGGDMDESSFSIADDIISFTGRAAPSPPPATPGSAQTRSRSPSLRRPPSARTRW